MIKYEVGKRFPHPEYLNRGEITTAIINSAFFDVVCVIGGISPNEKKDWSKGKLSVLLYEKEQIPFVVFAFDTWNFDVSININKVQQNKIDDWLNASGNIINLYLVEASSGVLVAMRMISIPASMAEKIRDMCETQSELSAQHIDLKIKSILELVTTQEMVTGSTLKYKLG